MVQIENWYIKTKILCTKKLYWYNLLLKKSLKTKRIKDLYTKTMRIEDKIEEYLKSTKWTKKLLKIQNKSNLYNKMMKKDLIFRINVFECYLFQTWILNRWHYNFAKRKSLQWRFRCLHSKKLVAIWIKLKQFEVVIPS